MSDDDEELGRLRNRVSRLEDQVEHVLLQKIEGQSDLLAEKSARIEELESTVEQMSERLDSVVDVDSADDSSPEARSVALREAMIRASGENAGSFSGGVTWWWKEVRDQLASHGHGDFSKPVYHSAIEDASEKDGFTVTTKEVISGGQRRNVKAIQLDPDEVTSPRLRNQLTTRVGVTTGANSASTDGGTVDTQDNT